MKKYMNIKHLSTTIDISPRTIRKWITDPVNPVPCFRVGGKFLFEESEVIQWLEQFRVKTTDINAMVDEILNAINMEKNN